MKNLKLLLAAALLSIAVISNAQNGLNFDGIDDYIETSYSGIQGNNPITVEAWVKPNNGGEKIITAWGSDFYNGGRFTVRAANQGANDVLRVEIKGGGINGTVNLSDGNWHHVAVTYDPNLTTNKYKLYVDGNLDVEDDIATTLNVGQDVNVRIGRRIHATYTGWFTGDMDEIRIWDVARSQSELQSNMNQEFCSSPTGLTAYFKLNEGTAGSDNTGITSVIDEVSGNNGVLNDFTQDGAASNWITGSGISDGSVTNNQTFTECDGFTVTVGTNTYDQTGVYTDVLTAVNGCDSTVTTDLTILPALSSTQTLNECEGFSITVGTNTYDQTGVYTDVLTSVDGCDSTVTTGLTINTIDNTVTRTGVEISANATGLSYQWLDCDDNYAPISGETAATYTASVNGSYAVEITDGSCVDTSACEAILGVGIEQLQENTFTIYPNPTKNIINIEASNIKNNTNIVIYSVLGTVVYESNWNKGQIMQIDVKSLKAGAYFISIVNDGQKNTMKFIKQ